MSEFRQHIDDLNRFFREDGIEHFTGSETLQLLRLGVTAPVPPTRLWHGMALALSIAEGIRAEYGGPLVIANGYRPKDLNKRAKGIKRSQHIQYRALDLQLPHSKIGSTSSQEKLYTAAAVVFLRYPAMKIGLGIYRPVRGPRVHIDVGFRRRVWGGPRRSWGGRSKAWVNDLLDENR